jgi:hypothetical protein
MFKSSVKGIDELMNSFGRFESTAILWNVGTRCNITEDSNSRNLNYKCNCKLMRIFLRKGVRKPIFRLAVLWDTKCDFDTAENTNPENVVIQHEHVDHSVRIYRFYKSGVHPRAEGSRDKAPPQILILKTDFVVTITLSVSCDLSFSRNQSLESVDG